MDCFGACAESNLGANTLGFGGGGWAAINGVAGTFAFADVEAS